MLHVTRLWRARRHAQTHRAIVDAPDRRDGRITLTDEATIGIRIGREYGHRFRHAVLHAADGLAQAFGTSRIVTGEQILALWVVEADVHVQPAAGARRERLGHETGEEPVLLRHAAQHP